MVYTRAQNSQALAAARTLVQMKGHRIHVDHAAPIATGQSNMRIYVHTPGYRLVKEVPFTEPKPVSPVTRSSSASRTVSAQQFWSSWSTWYAAFVSEVEDEGVRGTRRFSDADDRWTTFAARMFRCEEAQVRRWLASTPAPRRLPAAGF